ncbi:NUDIX domain-containing protein [Planomicrobium sp. YIM 101495]|uniref:NUDIX domain-containing protein n=1 Tax=Planomicrobium sp. YIM 101495 TaxID=2665160 RepID=UPI0012B71D06|nr:NUDIX domain-containing protein [Planomicrobium sp. YIM 101495]MTD29907.1 NUDIX domain-containing protein [Planomicrobium sp. YIM 101495]
MRVFGEELENTHYQRRKGVYAVIFTPEKDEVLTVRNRKGDHFLPGGGVENGENHLECLERELLEETGYHAQVGPYIGNALQYLHSTKGEPLLSDGHFYSANLLHKMQAPIDEDHYIEWLRIDRANELLIREQHRWAVKEGLNR